MYKIKVFLLDDYVLLRDGIHMLLKNLPDIEVIGECGEKADALRMIENIMPDVLLANIGLPGLIDTIQLLKEICPSTKVLITRLEETDLYLFDLLEAGISGCIVKNGDGEELISAIREVYNGNIHLSPSVSGVLVRNYLQRVFSKRRRRSPGDLTQREKEILTYIVNDKHNKEIAALLDISTRTVQTHRTNIMGKLGAHDRVQLIKYAIRKGIINL